MKISFRPDEEGYKWSKGASLQCPGCFLPTTRLISSEGLQNDRGYLAEFVLSLYQSQAESDKSTREQAWKRAKFRMTDYELYCPMILRNHLAVDAEVRVFAKRKGAPEMMCERLIKRGKRFLVHAANPNAPHLLSIKIGQAAWSTSFIIVSYWFCSFRFTASSLGPRTWT